MKDVKAVCRKCGSPYVAGDDGMCVVCGAKRKVKVVKDEKGPVAARGRRPLVKIDGAR